MHSEHYFISKEVADILNEEKKQVSEENLM